MDLTDKVAVITGASSGIGAATARELHAAGARLVLTARREDRLRALAGELRGAVYVARDVLDPKLPDDLIARAVESFGRCDVVFNNAGVIEVGTVDAIDIDRVCHMARVNVEAAFRLAYVAARHLKKAGGGHLVNTSSILGTKTRPTAGAYAGTKWAIEALSEALRLELAGTGVKVTSVQPGLVMTELHDRWEVHPSRSMNVSHPLMPVDVARAVRWVLEQPDHLNVPKINVMPSEQGNV